MALRASVFVAGWDARRSTAQFCENYATIPSRAAANQCGVMGNCFLSSAAASELRARRGRGESHGVAHFVRVLAAS